MLKVGPLNLIKAKLDFWGLKMYLTCVAPHGCTLLVLCPKRDKVGHIDLIN